MLIAGRMGWMGEKEKEREREKEKEKEVKQRRTIPNKTKTDQVLASAPVMSDAAVRVVYHDQLLL